MIHITENNRSVYLNPKHISAIENVINSDSTWEVQVVMLNNEVYTFHMKNGEFIDLLHKWTFPEIYHD